MYITVMSQEPDALAFIDLILTGFIKANTTTGRFMVCDDSFYDQTPEALMLFD